MVICDPNHTDRRTSGSGFLRAIWSVLRVQLTKETSSWQVVRGRDQQRQGLARLFPPLTCRTLLAVFAPYHLWTSLRCEQWRGAGLTGPQGSVKCWV